MHTQITSQVFLSIWKMILNPLNKQRTFLGLEMSLVPDTGLDEKYVI